MYKVINFQVFIYMTQILGYLKNRGICIFVCIFIKLFKYYYIIILLNSPLLFPQFI